MQANRLPRILAYTHTFTLRRTPNPSNRFYKVDRDFNADGTRKTRIVHLDHVVQQCPLVPRFGRDSSTLNVTSDDCLEICTKFYINCFHSAHTYKTVY